MPPHTTNHWFQPPDFHYSLKHHFSWPAPTPAHHPSASISGETSAAAAASVRPTMSSAFAAAEGAAAVGAGGAGGAGGNFGGGHGTGFTARGYGYHGLHPGYYRRRFGFGRRLVWFGLGVGAATWYFHHKERARQGLNDSSPTRQRPSYPLAESWSDKSLSPAPPSSAENGMARHGNDVIRSTGVAPGWKDSIPRNASSMMAPTSVPAWPSAQIETHNDTSELHVPDQQIAETAKTDHRAEKRWPSWAEYRRERKREKRAKAEADADAEALALYRANMEGQRRRDEELKLESLIPDPVEAAKLRAMVERLSSERLTEAVEALRVAIKEDEKRRRGEKLV